MDTTTHEPGEPGDGAESVVADADPVVLVVVGELEAGRLADLGAAIDAALQDPAADLVVDLSGVTFLPSTALGVLVEARRRADAAGSSFEVLARAGTIAHRVLTVTAVPHRTP